MSFLTTVAIPLQAALPYAQSTLRVAGAVGRPLLGFGALMSFFVFFRPLIAGAFHAVKLMFSPAQSLEERKGRRTLSGILMLNRMANDLDESQPNLAAELRLLAGRG